ncbi:MAG: hypothetical protein RIC55_19480 [Pirellulaceae bacterium]
MSNPPTPPELTPEQQNALDANDGIVHGPSYVLMRTDVLFDWFGFTSDELRAKLAPAFEDVERGDVAEWNLNEFLAKVHERRQSKRE